MNNEQLQAKLSAAEQEIRELRDKAWTADQIFERAQVVERERDAVISDFNRAYNKLLPVLEQGGRFFIPVTLEARAEAIATYLQNVRRERDAERARLREVREAVVALITTEPRIWRFNYAKASDVRLEAIKDALAAIDRIAGSDVSPEKINGKSGGCHEGVHAECDLDRTTCSCWCHTAALSAKGTPGVSPEQDKEKTNGSVS